MKKIIKLCIACSMIFTLFNVNTKQVSAATNVYESEYNNDFKSADSFSLGNTIIGSITENDERDMFKFTVPSQGKITLNMTSYKEYYCMYIYDANGNQVWSTEYNSWNENVGYISKTHTIYLEKGTYYLETNGYRESYHYNKSTGKYVIKTSFKSSGTNDTQNNNDFKTATSLSLGQTKIGQISENDDKDLYKFIVPSQGKITLNMTSYKEYYCMYIYDANGNQVWGTEYNSWNENVGYISKTHTIYLEKGTYYLEANGYRWNHSYDKSNGRYVIKTAFKSSATNDTQNNNDFKTATSLSLGQTKIGQISENDDFDLYKFSIKSSGYVTLNMTSYKEWYSLRLYNIKGEEIWYSEYNQWNESIGYCKNTHVLQLKPGTYYLESNGYRWNDYDKSTGKYILKTAFHYTQAKPSISLTKTSYNTLRVNWKKMSGASGYEIYRSTSKNGSYKKIAIVGANTTSYKNSGLSAGKTYYYKIRAYRNVSGKKYYSYTSSIAGHKIMPDKVSKLRTTSVGTSSIKIAWNKVRGAHGYEVYRSTSSKGKYTKVKTLKSNVFTNIKISSGRDYYYKVRAYRVVGNKKVYGSMSNVLYTGTKPQKMSMTRLTSTNKGKLTASWRKTTANGYVLQYSTSNKFKGAKTITLSSKTSARTIALKSKKKYYVRVRAYNTVAGKRVYGSWSNAKNVKIK